MNPASANRLRHAFLHAGALAFLAASGCDGRKDQGPMNPIPMTPADSTALPIAADGRPEQANAAATAELRATEGSHASGTVKVAPAGDGLRITIDMSGLTPGPHGFHIHENGDCSAPDASSAGGHFNPDSMPHGAPDARQRHVGDFGNLEADSSGKAHAVFTADRLSLAAENAVIGRAVVVHAQIDDLTTQPSGNSGTPAACGVIQDDSSRS